MSTTTANFSFIIPDGSDSVNLLTQNYPNFTSLDSILVPIRDNGVTPATHTKVGTVHQLVRTATSCDAFKFVATGNYSAGDTFTVDGVSVTATMVTGASLPAGAFVINQSVLCILNGSVLTVYAGGVSSIDASDVVYDNTVSGLTATDVQNAIDELASEDASDISYDNTVSGLTASNVQEAIDELASGGTSEHGYYELWKNTDISNDFSAQTITLYNIDPSRIDAIEILYETLSDEGRGTKPVQFDKDVLDIPGYQGAMYEFNVSAGKIVTYQRNVSFSLAGTTLGVTFTACTQTVIASYGTAGTGSTQNGKMVPVRILALVHNS